jgi:hypothetical protein
MASSRFLISSQTLASSAASVTFSSIPATYTNLVLRISARTAQATTNANLKVILNADTATNYSETQLSGDGATASSGQGSARAFSYYYAVANGDSMTANSFGSFELYIPSYTASQKKPLSGFGNTETNSTTSYITATAALWQGTAAITSIQILPTINNFMSTSSFYLYGLRSS